MFHKTFKLYLFKGAMNFNVFFFFFFFVVVVVSFCFLFFYIFWSFGTVGSTLLFGNRVVLIPGREGFASAIISLTLN